MIIPNPPHLLVILLFRVVHSFSSISHNFPCSRGLSSFTSAPAAVKTGGFVFIAFSSDFHHSSLNLSGTGGEDSLVDVSEPDEGILSSSVSDNTDTKLPVFNQEKSPYPINLPSPLLLSVSMVLAIISIGSIFELTEASPRLGYGTTAAIALLGLPSCLFLFYASIQKGIAETEEDDKEYNKPRSF